MAGQTQKDLNQHWLTLDTLIEFVDELRQAGFNIGIAEYIAAQDLLLMLIARGERLENPQRVASLLGPLLCSSPAEQITFPEYFLRWVERYQVIPDAETNHTETMAEALEDIVKRGLRWRWILIAVGVVILGLTAWFVSLNLESVKIPTPTTTQTPVTQGSVPSTTSSTLALSRFVFVVITLLVLITYFAWRIWWRQMANRFLQRRQSKGPPDVKRISLLASDEAIFPSLTFLSLARLYRQRIPVASKALNVIRTVENSVEQGGWLEPTYERLMIPPEYLVLVDRKSRFDHLAEFMEGMVKRLEAHGVFITAYAFDSDPRLCFPIHGKEAPQSLYELAARYENMRLIVFTDGQSLLSPVSGRLANWTRLFDRWTYRSVLTPESRSNWGEIERELQNEFTVLPGSADGLASFMRIIQAQEKVSEIVTWSNSAIPITLQERPQRWIERDSPPASHIDSLLENLKMYLGQDGYAWLVACSVYPELQWQITITLGQLLKDTNGKPLLEPKLLVDLARLPWFRYGSIPDWLRIRLISDLSLNQEKDIRAIIEVLLVTAIQGHGESLDLEIAYERRDWTSHLVRPLLRILHRQVPLDSPIQDRIFLDFMLHRSNLAVKVPEALRRRWFGEQSLTRTIFSSSPRTLTSLFGEQELMRTIFASSVGTTIQWYDFYIFGSLATVIASKFYQTGTPIGDLIAWLATFAIGFGVRPFGAIVFGRAGDLIGRKYTFLVTMTLMGLCTFAIGLLPTIDVLGAWAGIILISLRILQGLALGGEYVGAVTYVAEHAPHGRRGFFTSWIQITATLGLFLSLGVILTTRKVVGEDAFSAWGWRVPFLISIFLVAISLYIRFSLRESPMYAKLKQKGGTSKNPIRESFGNPYNLRYVLLALFGATMGQGVVWYTGQFYALFYLQRIFSVNLLDSNLIVGAALLVGAPLFVYFGNLSDKIGRKKIMLWGMILPVLMYYPIYSLMASFAPQPAADKAPLQLLFFPYFGYNPFMLSVLVLVQVIFVTMVYGPVAAFLVELFPTKIRYTSISLPYHIGNGVFAGLVPIIGLQLLTKTGNNYAGLWYPMVVVAICAVICFLTIPETYMVDIESDASVATVGKVSSQQIR